MARSATRPIRVGVAGWDYADWRGVVYPQPRPPNFDPVRYLANYIDLIEINSTFYRPPRKDVAKRWADRVGDCENFHFSAKLWRRFTHERGTAWTRAEVNAVKQGFDPLHRAAKLSAVLVQFPWSFRNDDTNREWLQDVQRTFARFPLVVEVRHESWNSPEFFAWLVENGVGFVNIDQPLFRKSIKPSAHGTSRIGYVRVHGRNYKDWFRKDAGRDARYDYLYPADELKPWVRRAREVARDEEVEEVDVVFNNHYKGQAVVNALQFKKLMTRRKIVAPEPLVEAYPEALEAVAVPAKGPATASRSRARPRAPAPH
jgi:uncharacterized protein YecE (DUF72 family)